MNRSIFGLLFFLAATTYGQSFHSDTTFMILGTKSKISLDFYDGKYSIFNFYRENIKYLEDTIDYYGPGGGEDFIDFNEDGYIDYLLTQIGNNPRSNLYLFNTEKIVFQNVKHFDAFPQSKLLNSQLGIYYSYHRAGCADMNWVSDLYKIEDYTAIRLGTINAIGCEDEDEDSKRRIDIEKAISQERRSLVESFPYDIIETFNYDKWKFIEYYWTKNYIKFK